MERSLTLICAQCQKVSPRTGQRQTYCADCAKSRKRARGTAAERRRRERLGDELRARDRERYATDPRVRQQRIDDAMARYWALKDDPEALAQRRQRTAAAQARHRDKTMYGGNRVPALERDGYTCQSCGASPDYLEVHHIDGRGSMLPVAEQNNDLTNLVTLCGPCHAKVHRRQENFLRNRGTRGEREEQQQD